MPDMSKLSDAQILEKVLAQPETAQLAATLGMSVDNYAKMVVHYIRNPEAEPELELMSDEDARKAGMPSTEDCVTFLERAVDDELKKDSARFAGFDDDERSASSLTGGSAPKVAPREGEARGAVVDSSDQEAAHQLKQEISHARNRRPV